MDSKTGGKLFLRYAIVVLAIAGMAVSALALHVHYSSDLQPCDINAHWDCGIVNHSRYSMFHGIPVAAFGIAGYLVIALLSWLNQPRLASFAALLGFCYALYLSRIEAYELQVWCLYCVISQGLIALILVSSGILAALSTRKAGVAP